MKIQSLSEEQRAKLPVYKQMFLDKFFNEKIALKEEVESYIHWFYSTFNISRNKKPKVILLNSPMECLIAINVIEKIVKKDEVRNEVENEVRNEVWNEVENEVWNEVENEVWSEVVSEVESEVESEVWSEVRSEVESEVENEVWSEVESEVENEVWSEVVSEVRSEVRSEVEREVWSEVESEVEDEVRKNKKIQYFTPSYYLSAFNSWVSFYSFFDNECFKLKKSEIFNKYAKILDLNILWCIPFKNYVFISRNAIKYIRNEQKQLHSTTEAAVQFGGKFAYKQYFVNGRNISEKRFKQVLENRLTFDEFSRIQNEDEKACIVTMIKENGGNEKLLQFLNAELIDEQNFLHENGYIEKQRLYKTRNTFSWAVDRFGNTNVSLAWNEMVCPSTGAVYLIETCPTFTSVLESAKWLRPKQIPSSLNYKWQSAN